MGSLLALLVTMRIHAIIFNENKIKSKNMSTQDDRLLNKILLFILTRNFFIDVVDQIKDTKVYKNSLKMKLNSLDKELMDLGKTQAFSDFYKNANSVDYINFNDLQKDFFEKFSSMDISEMVDFMNDFINKHRELPIDR